MRTVSVLYNPHPLGVDSSKERLLTLIELLQVRSRMSAPEIAERLEVSPRTVRRYIQGLQEMGIPVDAERGPAGGYRMRPGYRLPPLMFSNDEALALVVGLLAVEHIGMVAPRGAVDGALAKLSRVLPASLRDRLVAIQETLHLSLSPAGGTAGHADTDTVLTFTTAARDRVRLRVRYRSAAGEETDRAVDPYGVAFHGGHWYAVVWDHLRDALRTLRLDRLLAVETTRETFARPAGVDVADEVRRSMARVPYPWMAEVRLGLSMEAARRLVSPTVGTLHTAEDGVRLRLGGDDLEWIVRYLVGLGADFTVLRPPELREALRAEAERLRRCAIPA